jgi:tryptophan synthase beta chain
MSTSSVSDDGYYGEFGGAFIPEMLHKPVKDLQDCYSSIITQPSFLQEFNELLRDFVGRPSPLYFAPRLSSVVKGKIYLKREDLNHTGAHKINNTVGQILLARHLGKTRIIAETGAGQHGVATATVCARMGVECNIYMGEVDIARQSPNVRKMRLLGANVIPVTSGSRTLKDATNEAMRDWIANPIDTHYIIGSAVGPHPFPEMVAHFQSVISKEIGSQLESQIGRTTPDTVIACVGGGSNAIGAFYHFIDDSSVRLIGVEAAGEGVESGKSAATLALGKVGILHGCKTVVMQTSDGQIEEAHSISAGLDYPGIGPQHAYLHATERVKYVSVTDNEALSAAALLAKLEGIIPALETAHALAYLPKVPRHSDEVIVLCLSGDGEKDMQTYLSHFENNLEK